MRIAKPDHHAGPVGLLDDEEVDPALDPEGDPEAYADPEEADLVRVTCSHCRKPIALAAQDGGAEDSALPEHALCPTPWDPFGLTVCPGSGRSVGGDAGAAQEPAERGDGGGVARLTLPEGLDWRLQPFSDPPVALPSVRQAA